MTEPNPSNGISKLPQPASKRKSGRPTFADKMQMAAKEYCEEHYPEEVKNMTDDEMTKKWVDKLKEDGRRSAASMPPQPETPAQPEIPAEISAEKIAEAATALRTSFGKKPTMSVLLQVTPYPARARCAATYCLKQSDPEIRSSTVDDPFRIAMGSSAPKIYHVGCIEAMFNPADVFFPRFALDLKGYAWNDYYPTTWGLLVRKWFEHKGLINLDKLVAYVDAYEAFEKEIRETSGTIKENKEKKPALGDYDYKQDGLCPLSDVLEHEYVGKLQPSIQVSIQPGHGRAIRLVNPERD